MEKKIEHEFSSSNKELLKAYFVMQLSTLRHTPLIYKILIVLPTFIFILLNFLTTITLNVQNTIIFIEQLTSIVLFLFPTYIVFIDKQNGFYEFNHIDLSPKQQNDLHVSKQDLIAFYNAHALKLAFSMLFLKVLIFSFASIAMLWIMSNFVILSTRLTFLFSVKTIVFAGVFAIFALIFWFMFYVCLHMIVKKKYTLIVVQIISLIMLFGGGYIFPINFFDLSVNTITQILPARAIGDLMAYILLDSPLPGGAVVSFGEFFVLFACLFGISISWYKNNCKQEYAYFDRPA